MLKIYSAETDEDLEIVKTLVVEYLNFLKNRFYKYVDWQWADGHCQNLEQEIRGLQSDYRLRKGCILLADYQGRAAGCVVLKGLSDGTCQMKRFYVRPQFRNLGIGKELAKAVIEQGRALGYHSMRVHTNQLLDTALKLYVSLGFKEILPYEQSLTETSVFMELKLI